MMTKRLHPPIHRLLPILIAAGGLALLLCLAWAGVAQAQEGAGDALCIECHWTESDSWEKSPHAAQDIGCETCHGAYAPGHPEDANMKLTADGKVCMDCHTDAAVQWRASEHAQHKVACTSCHVSHSQDTRLSGEWLCGSCHGDQIHNFTHTSHHTAGITCINCHASVPEGEQAEGETMAVSHRFSTVNSQACLDCHAQTIHEQCTDPLAEVSVVQQAEATSKQLAEQLAGLEKTSRQWQTASVVSLGMGLGIGGALGVLFAIALFYLYRRGRTS